MLIFPNAFPVFIPALLWLVGGRQYIALLQKMMLGQYVRVEGPQEHQKKSGTPTMGGLYSVLVVLLSLLGFLVAMPQLLTMRLVWCILILLAFCGLGFSDDIVKVLKKNNNGISGWLKLSVQGLLSLALGAWMLGQPNGSVIQIFGLGHFDLGYAYPVLVFLIITGASNAYNLTDGLDGLAGGAGAITFLTFAVILGQAHPELMLLSLLLAGSLLGFLGFNKHPAQIFMGDTGSLAFGGVMGAFAVLSKTELLLVLLGALYVVETLSVMLQVTWFKLSQGKRLFKMSPLHHHFELCGWQETTVVATFVVFQLVMAVLGVLLYNGNH
jgi:phospho-N-acetylmuramoyl-pentapeptide-transferase